MEKMNFSDITIIIPTINESENIGNLIKSICKLYPGVNVTVSDFKSRDGTQTIVGKIGKKNKKVRLVRNKKGGIAIQVLTALDTVKTKYFLVIDGDFQHPPEKIKEIAEKLRTGHTIVVGTREKVLCKWPIQRKIISKGATLLGHARLIGRARCKDIMSGFFGMETDLAKQLYKKHPHKFEMAGYKILFDFLKIVPRKTKVGEVYYQFGLRKGGSSKIKTKHIILYLKSLFK